MRQMLIGTVLGIATLGAPAVAQQQAARIPSPRGAAATEIGGTYIPGKPAATYQGGKWIEIDYGRPIKRGRELWGEGSDYGRALLAGAPVWRAGANVSTRLETEVPLVVGGTTIAPGEYSVFIDLAPDDWTFIVSTWPAQARYDPENKEALWGAYGYTPARDVVRAPMTLENLPVAFDQLTWQFADMTADGGKLVLTWDTVMASVSFKVGT